MADVDAQTAALQFWSLREAEQADQFTGNAQAAAWSLWSVFGGWYSSEQVAGVAKQTTSIMQSVRAATGNLGIAYMREVLAGLRATQVVPTKLELPPARLGADLLQVYSRPAEAYRATFSTTGDHEQALAAARLRSDQLLAADTLIARRDGEHQQMVAAKVQRYRRVVHPERSKTGVCGLCLAASDRVYKISDLMPIHAECKCTTAEITAGYDPAASNKVDLEKLYEDAGGTTDGRALKKVRYQVNEHGELGPVLTRSGDNFQGKDQAPKGNPVDRARQELASLQPVLTKLEDAAAAGKDVSAPLKYQRARIAKLRRVVDAAA